MSKSSKEQYKYKVVVIIWDDAESSDGWEEAPEELEPKLATSVGFLVRQTEKYVLIAQSYDNGHTNGRFQIPKGMIKEIKEIK